MSRETDNKAIVARWFEGFWANPWNPKIIDELAADPTWTAGRDFAIENGRNAGG